MPEYIQSCQGPFFLLPAEAFGSLSTIPLSFIHFVIHQRDSLDICAGHAESNLRYSPSLN